MIAYAVKTAYIKALTDNRGFVMSNSKKPNQHLENLIKADGYHALPIWWQEFVHQLMMIGQATHNGVLYVREDRARGFLGGVQCCGFLNAQQKANLDILLDEAIKYQESYLRMNKAA